MHGFLGWMRHQHDPGVPPATCQGDLCHGDSLKHCPDLSLCVPSGAESHLTQSLLGFVNRSESVRSK